MALGGRIDRSRVGRPGRDQIDQSRALAGCSPALTHHRHVRRHQGRWTYRRVASKMRSDARREIEGRDGVTGEPRAPVAHDQPTPRLGIIVVEKSRERFGRSSYRAGRTPLGAPDLPPRTRRAHALWAVFYSRPSAPRLAVGTNRRRTSCLNPIPHDDATKRELHLTQRRRPSVDSIRAF